ncbi:MAG: hypothetical protein ACI3ZN_11180, partial [Candidatus Cryptobacteroides sp.]
ELDGNVVDTLCGYLDANVDYVFRNNTPLDLSFLFQIQDKVRSIAELFYEKRIPQNSVQFRKGVPILDQIEEKGYEWPFLADGRKVFRIGANFSTKNHRLENWKVE